MKNQKFEKIRTDLRVLESNYEVVIFGSAIEGGFRPESDIDIAVITRNQKKERNREIQRYLWSQYSMNYDIHVFELLPIIVQASIFNNYKVVFGDILDISEYFYFYRKIWKDCKKRIIENQFDSYKNWMKILSQK